uniref:Major facilitator superfamily (MFS) profile domain-containing protein n=2 Tax=Corethron hystrix TaxID=216773 RepID=A0A7S1BDR8_9STRA|mmetsp:Transcript_22283/g.51044  ORF Transcript_22283/g.51044 Transcript_22283/m.51044 type:complete len:605 (+) Transcript_22283:252-2066(+)|eukprot:CAMPEP_0113307990 /NCGR_PEP_ID=MMETSP0010_2-20120614/6611_1 /TAXON_ID=216773 ORGANISM="Corethron hystrix, Strain 308" /NCGR_SAMPLE_ID=MMETSP0010_2 /ASSEMBLY_ACC=CAM_ASM_000155 /LENGTH=604 /DNA_ID=CAMNT_0000162949 /DNA_START=99 /DNA_END=1913 /DNA_ORIENTATION=+ /assembly_acc=CAM_ASM_000155
MPPSDNAESDTININDVEGGTGQSEKKAELSCIDSSLGWCPLPQVKLASWAPENEKQWNNGGSQIAMRNLLASIPNLFCAFGVWLSWSIIVVRIQAMHDEDPAVYPFADFDSPKGKAYKSLLYTLPAIAGLSGGTLRIPNSFMTQVIGGRNVVYQTSILLTIPMVMTAIGLSSNNCPFSYILVCAMLSGVGGGAFASSMSNMSFLFPKTKQGMALGYNGGIGNLGVSASQLILPLCMTASFGKDPISGIVEGWPANAGWFWWPVCLLSALLSFLWMSNHPDHGNHNKGKMDTLWCLIYFYWLEITGILAAFISVITLIKTRNSEAFTSSASGKVGHKFLLVIISCTVEHLFMWFLSPSPVKTKIKAQAVMFKDKNTWIMTYLYIMCFGSFIGFSGAFPKLIQDLFGYIKTPGCTVDDVFTSGGLEEDCAGDWEVVDVVNPNAPSVANFAWIGAAVGSLVRPVGGILADKYGGAKVTMILILWSIVAAIAQGLVVTEAGKRDDPTGLFGWFAFLFVNLFFCVGMMNGTTFGTIGVLFNEDLRGAVLGWSSAIASYGAFVIPALFGVSIAEDKAEITLYALAGYYITCAILNYWYYMRPGCANPGV